MREDIIATLKPWHVLKVTCLQCRHESIVSPAPLVRRFGEHKNLAPPERDRAVTGDGAGRWGRGALALAQHTGDFTSGGAFYLGCALPSMAADAGTSERQLAFGSGQTRAAASRIVLELHRTVPRSSGAAHRYRDGVRQRTPATSAHCPPVVEAFDRALARLP